MRHFLFVFLFLGVTVYLRAGGIPYLGSDQMAKLIEAVENVKTADAFTNDQPMRKDDWSANNEAAWWKVPGFCFTESGQQVEPKEDDDVVYVTYRGEDKRFAMRSIDWANKGYIQKKHSIISLIQHPNPDRITSNDPDGIRRDADNKELRWLKYLNFSGNFFHTIEIDGSNLLNQLEKIDLSNNPTLSYLYIVGCPNPNLVIDISRSGFTLSQIYQLFLTGDFINPDYSIQPFVAYGNQNATGDIPKKCAVDHVDLSAENVFHHFTSTYTFTTEEGTPLFPNVEQPGVFSFHNDFIGSSVYCVIKNNFFTAIPEGVKLKIQLVDANDFSIIEKTNTGEASVFYSNEQLFIQSNNGHVVTDIYSISGQKILSSSATIIDVSFVNKGVYLAKTSVNGWVSVVKFIKY